MGSANRKPNTGAHTLPNRVHKVRTGLAWSHIEDDIVSCVQCFPFLLPSSPGPSSSFLGPSRFPGQHPWRWQPSWRWRPPWRWTCRQLAGPDKDPNYELGLGVKLGVGLHVKLDVDLCIKLDVNLDIEIYIVLDNELALKLGNNLGVKLDVKPVVKLAVNLGVRLSLKLGIDLLPLPLSIDLGVKAGAGFVPLLCFFTSCFFVLFFSFLYFFTSCFLFSGSGILIPTAATMLLQVKYRSQDAEVFIPWLLCIDSLPVCRPQRMWGQPTGSQRPVRIHCRTRFTRTEVALSHIEDNMVSCVQSCSVLDADFLNVHIKSFSFWA